MNGHEEGELSANDQIPFLSEMDENTPIGWKSALGVHLLKPKRPGVYGDPANTVIPATDTITQESGVLMGMNLSYSHDSLVSPQTS